MSAVVIPERMPAFLKAMGGRWKDGRGSYRMRWGELSLLKRGCAAELCLFDTDYGPGRYSLHLHLFWISAYINLRFLDRWAYEPDEMMEAWGFSLHPGDMGLHLHWGAHTKIITMPWRDWEQVSHDVRRSDGSWAPYVGSWRDEEPDGREILTYPYRYVLRSAEVQNRTATIYVERRIRKLKWLRALPFGRTSYAISVDFDGEVGERSGSWKGGCTGCGYELRENETPLECLRRMERERKF